MRKSALTRRQFLALGAATMVSASCEQPLFPSTSSQISHSLGKETDSPNIVVFLSDTLRADHVGCYGYPVNTTPFIDSIAEQGVVFEQCYAPSPWTKPSVASLDTGVVPIVHNAVASQFFADDMGALGVHVLRDDFITFSEILADKGYHTAWFLSNPHMQQEFGFGRGFSQYRFKSGEDPNSQMTAVLRHLSDHGKAPFLLFIHCVDPHGPYIPPSGVYSSLHGKRMSRVKASLSNHDKELLDSWESFYLTAMDEEEPTQPDFNELTPAGIEYLISLYDAEIAYVDMQVERLWRFLERQGALDNTYFFFTSDHGESFGERGSFFHHNNLHDEEIHVPLIAHGPRLPAGEQVPCSVGLIDLYSTIVTFGGGEIPEYCQSRPLFTPEGDITVKDDRPVYLEFDRVKEDPSRWETGLVKGPIKVLSKNNTDDLVAFDRDDDPEEQVNLVAEEPIPEPEVRRVARLLEEKREAMWTLSEEFGPPEWSVTDEKYMEDLRALGYL